VDIISMSFGSNPHQSTAQYHRRESYRNEIRLSGKILMLAAAGNHGGRQPHIAFPASSERILCIKSAGADKKESSFNPQNHNPDFVGHNLMADGEEVLTMRPVEISEGGEMLLQKRFNGTSAATPLAAAYAALILEFSRQEDDTSQGRDIRYLENCRNTFKADIFESMKKVFRMMSVEHGIGQTVNNLRYLSLDQLFVPGNQFRRVARRLADFLELKMDEDL
jgi:hypothetical protein